MMYAAAGVILGVLYTLSPLSACCAVWVAGLIWWTVRGTGARERRWVASVLIAAAAIRAALVAVLPFTFAPGERTFTSYFGDAVYAIQRSIWIRNVFVGVPIAPRDFFEAFEPVFGYSSYNVVLAYLHTLFGPSPYGVALVTAAIFLTAAAILYRRCRAAFGPLPAIAALCATVLLPSWIAWTVAPLKEAIELLLIVLAIEATVLVFRGRVSMRVLGAMAVAAALAASATLRTGSGAVAAASIGGGVLLYFVTRRWWLIAAAAVVLPVVLLVAMREPPIHQRVAAAVLDAAKRHRGHTFSTGAYYRILDETFYQVRDFNEPIYIHQDEAIRFLGRAPLALLAEPLPWALDSPKWALVVPQQVIWYALLLLAIVGVAAGGRRDPLTTCLFAGVIVAAVAIIAPNSGNIGTAIRHRDVIAPFVAGLAGIGGQAIANRMAQKAKVTI